MKFCEIFPLLLTVCTVVKSKGKISQNCVAFSEYMNFKTLILKVQILIFSKKIKSFPYWTLSPSNTYLVKFGRKYFGPITRQAYLQSYFHTY